MILNWLDGSFIVLLLGSAFWGIWRGLAREFATLSAWILGLYGAVKFATVHLPGISIAFLPPTVQPWVQGGIILGVTLFIGYLIGKLLTWLFTTLGLAPLNRLAGLCFGVVRGALIALLSISALAYTDFPKQPVWQNSQLIPYFLRITDWGMQQLPVELTNHFPEQLKKLVKTAPPLPTLNKQV